MSKGDLRTVLAGVSPEEGAKISKEFEGKSESEIAATTTNRLCVRHSEHLLRTELTILRTDPDPVTAGAVTIARCRRPGSRDRVCGA